MPHREPMGRAMSRRFVLTSGVAGLGALGLGLSTDTGIPVNQAMPLGGNVSVEQIRSRSRGRRVDMVVMHPRGIDPEGLPVCLMLHGRHGDALDLVAGMPTWLSESFERGIVPPFTVLAVDGGRTSYWHDDPMTMLLEEVPGWLAERGLGGPGGRIAAVSGISMGGFGALLYARRRRELGDPVSAAGVISPALFTSWKAMRTRNAFRNEAEWASLDPLRHVDALGDLPLGVWCGNADRFIKGTRRFIQRARPDVASTTPGRHNRAYFRKAMPELVDFIGPHLA
ncbi:alpha/beta hydrolase [Saccharopolyspora griseoalba]|uniref:Acyl-CoA:diacylglycerol acyltransferase n=1 Tax=Saccharopolyspora griseoalba TaxID=1431848 RepID=A0ABW2LN54_9PSEU